MEPQEEEPNRLPVLLPADAAEARLQAFQLSVVSGGERESSLSIFIVGAQTASTHPVELTDHHWRFTSVDVEDEGPVRIVLQAGESGASVALTRMQVRR